MEAMKGEANTDLPCPGTGAVTRGEGAREAGFREGEPQPEAMRRDLMTCRRK